MDVSSPTPHGVGGLKLSVRRYNMNPISPTPHGVGGLKYEYVIRYAVDRLSHPSRGGWIEITPAR